MIMIVSIIVGILIMSTRVSAYTAYECDPNSDPLLAVDLKPNLDCPLVPLIPDSNVVHIQILRSMESTPATFRTCQVEAIITQNHCGMHHHASMTAQGIRTEELPVPEEQCSLMHTNGIFKTPYGSMLEGISEAQTYRRTVVEVGTITGASCQGATYVPPGAHSAQTGMVVTVAYMIRLSSGSGEYRSITNTWIYRGVSFRLTDQLSGYHAAWGHVFGSRKELAGCTTSRLTVLYQGQADQYSRPRNSEEMDTSLTTEILVHDDTQIFLIERRARTTICGYAMWTTDYEQIYVLDGSPGSYTFQASPLINQAFSLSTYVDTKIAMVRKETRDNMETLHRAMIRKACTNRNANIRDMLTTARTAPQEFAYRLMSDMPGYGMAIRGDLGYIIKCHEVVVEAAPSDNRCYEQIAVVKNGTLAYMCPHTRLLQATGKEVRCDPRMPTGYKDGISMVYYGQNQVSPLVPTEITLPGEKDEEEWDWTSVGTTETLGIHTPQDVARWTTDLLFDEEASTIVHNFANRYVGNQAGEDPPNPVLIYGREGLKVLSATLYSEVYSHVREFGIIAAALWGLHTIFCIIRWIIGSIINVRELKVIYGWSWVILSGFWGTLASVFFRRAPKSPSAPLTPDPKQQEYTPEMYMEDRYETLAHSGPAEDSRLMNEMVLKTHDMINQSKHVYPHV